MMPKLTPAMCEAARSTDAGKLIDRLLADEIKRRGNTNAGRGGSILQQLWDAMCKAKGD